MGTKTISKGSELKVTREKYCTVGVVSRDLDSGFQGHLKVPRAVQEKIDKF